MKSRILHHEAGASSSVLLSFEDVLDPSEIGLARRQQTVSLLISLSLIPQREQLMSANMRIRHAMEVKTDRVGTDF